MSEPDIIYPDATSRGSGSERDLSENGDDGDGRDKRIVREVDGQSIGSVLPPESDGTCMLEGCSNPTFVDSITDLESEYCSRKHQEQVSLSSCAFVFPDMVFYVLH